MANPGVGTKFVSVNLNKSYGQPQQQQYHHHNNHQYGAGRNRAGGGGGGGGMVVLSRPRSSQKVAGTKLSVPHPLNLPSLRKEHERFDSSGSGGGPPGGASGVGGVRPSSSGMGWTKPAVVGEKDGFIGVGSDHTGDISISSVNHGFDQGGNGVVNGASKGNSSSLYVPPSVRSVGPAASGLSPSNQVPGKATVLRGEDFPSLQAALPVVSVSEKKQKDGLFQKQKQVMNENLGDEQGGRSGLSALVDMGLQSRNHVSNGENEKEGKKRGLGGAGMFEKDRRQEEFFPGPFPLVKLNLRSDWADDERDTGHGLMDRGRDHVFTKNEAYWDRDSDFPRPSVLPQKPTYNHFDRRGQRDNETGKITSSEAAKLDTFGRDTRATSREGREGNSWRVASHLVMDGFGIQEGGNERSGIGTRPYNQNRKLNYENKYVPSPFRDNVQHDNERRDVGYGHVARHPHSNSMDPFGGRASDRSSRESCGNEQYNNHRSDHFQSSSTSKSLFSLGGKGLTVNDPILSFGREKRPSSKNEKALFNDPFIRDFGAIGFDGHDPFDGAFVSLVKKKKDVVKQTDFHDPVRESFEAELERVQKVQEQERQRIIAEQERAMELARREEDERIRLAREQEEQQRRLEDEAREAACRAEQEKLELMRKAEEQRIAREEEKRRIIMEEERRKQAAKQKLLELEERIAKRHAETTKNNNSYILTDEKISVTATEKDGPKLADGGDWEDGERMVERITISASADSSGSNRPFEMGSRALFSRDASSSFLDRGKHHSSWKRDAFENGNSSSFLSHDRENGHHSPQHDSAVGGRVFSRKEAHGGPGFMSSKTYYKGGIPEPRMDDFRQIKGQRWDLSGDGDHFSRNLEFESEFHETLTERFGDGGWGQSHSRGTLYTPYHEHVYHNSETDGLYSFGRSRHSTRQPRVLPPPSMNSMQRSSYRGDQHPGPSTFTLNELPYNDGTRSKSTMQKMFDNSHQEIISTAQITDLNEDSTENAAQEMDMYTKRCDSQSSLSVSSPPDSPVHISHDDLDDSGDFPGSAADRKDGTLGLQVNESAALPIDGEKEKMMSDSSYDDEEWPIETDDPLQEQEEYDEDEDDYGEGDEAHDGEDENTNLAQEFEDLQLEEKGSPDMVDNLVLGFNEGVEVGMPNDEFERNLRDEDAKFVPPQVSVGNVKELGSFDGICSEEQALQNMTDSVELGLDDTSGIFQETEKKKMQDLVIQPKHVPQTSAASELMNHMDAPSTGLSSQAQVPLSTGQIFMSSAPSVHGQSEVPVKLQFGLFSGPSLIPSPVPAIQIGSIQMPLHLHPPVGPSGTQMHPSQPFFQFGQLQYTSPISQGVLPLAPQSMSFVEPTVPANFPLNQNAGDPLPIQSAQETSHNLIKGDLLSVSTDSQPGPLSQHLDLLSHGKVSKDGKLLPSTNAILKVEQGQGELSCTGDGNLMGESGFQMEESFMKTSKMLPTKELGDQPQTVKSSVQIASKDKDSNLVKGQGIITGGRRKRYVVKNTGFKSSLQPAEASQQDPGAFQRRPRRQRTEFRVRENADKKQSVGSISSSLYGDDKSNTDGKVTGARNGSKRVVIGSNRQPKQKFESDGLSSRLVAWETDSGGRVENGSVKQSLRKNVSHSGEDVDTSLQSGNIVRIFEQPGIKAPSDDDDFIEVRSKRQMLNDRREQREKEIKAKSRVTKTMRKPRSASQTTAGNINSSKISASVGGGSSSNSHTDFVSTERHGLGNIEVSVGFNTPIVSQPLPPIGTPTVKNDVQADKRSQTIKSTETSSLPVLSGGGKNLSSGLMFENKNKVLDNVQTSLDSWANSQINQQVMSLMQTQLNEAMKPGKLDSRSSIGDSTLSVGEPSLTSSSILAKDKSFPSASSTINSLLAGDKIQFGAVTSPTILPSSSRAIPHGIGNLGVCHPDIQMAHNLSAADNQRSMFFGKDKHSNESSMHLEDCEAEAEAAASAIAVAAISSDDIVANGLGTGPVSSDSKSFGGADIDDVSGDQHLASRSRAEESLSVALPADLSVETHPMSLWPPLPSPQHSSSQMLSHIPGGPPSHFPFYEMNPMLGGPIFAFGPHDEHASTQSQSHQKSNTPVSGPHGTWQHHSGVDSFYGHPAGFTGPFISPPGSIPGVQGPPHMVVYNHFAPVGQFGQVGLSFMGTTYIPPGKQPDWKHNPVSSAMVAGEGEMNSLDIVSAQRNPTSVPAPIQHLAPGSPLLPMTSPLAMFDAPPFQSAPDMSVQARWSHVSASPLQSVSASMPLQQQSEGVLPTQLNHGLSVDQSLAANRFSESQISRSSDNGRNIPGATDATVNQLPDELGLVDSSRSSSTRTLAQSSVPKSPSAITIQDASTTDGTQNCTSNSFSQNTSSAFKTQPSHQKTASGQLYNSSGYNYQRGGSVPQKNISGGEWSYRRMGYNGRNQSLGGEKNFPSSKMKQIYVAKQTTGATSTVVEHGKHEH